MVGARSLCEENINKIIFSDEKTFSIGRRSKKELEDQYQQGSYFILGKNNF